MLYREATEKADWDELPQLRWTVPVEMPKVVTCPNPMCGAEVDVGIGGDDEVQD